MIKQRMGGDNVDRHTVNGSKTVREITEKSENILN